MLSMATMKESPSVLIHVPAELLKLILEELYIIAPSSIAACRLVSRVWHELSTPILFRKVTLCADTTLGIHEALPDDIYFVLQKDGTLGLPENSSPKIVEIVRDRKEESCKRSKNRAVALVEHLLELRSNIAGPEQRARVVRELIVLNGRPPSLRRKGPFTESDVANETREVLSAIANGLESMSALRILRWNSYDALSGDIIDILACKSPFLKEIHLSRLQLSDITFPSNGKLVPVLPEPARFIPILSKLKSFRCTISDNNRPLLYKVLENCDKLEELGVTYSRMHRAEMYARVGQPWKPKLRMLELANTSFSGSVDLESAIQFCVSLDLSRLESIRLEKCADTFVFLRVLVDTIGFEALKKLSLWCVGVEVSVADIVSFIRSLGLLCCLESLEIADLGIKMDVDAIIYNKQLKVLRIAEWDARMPSRYQRDWALSSNGSGLWTVDDVQRLGEGCTGLSELWIDVAHRVELDEDLIASFGSLRVLKKLGLCFQPPWKPLHSEIFFDENSPYENGERLLDLGQATILRIAQLIHARGGRELREIEIQHGCRERPAERDCLYALASGEGGARKVWGVNPGKLDALEVFLVREDRLVNRYGVPVHYEFEGW